MDFKDEIIAKLTQQNAQLTEHLNQALSKITLLETKIDELEKKAKKKIQQIAINLPLLMG